MSCRKFGLLGPQLFGHGIYFIPVPPHPTLSPVCGGEGKGEAVRRIPLFGKEGLGEILKAPHKFLGAF